tara:strand:+ start:827 stop:1174 length:348 start_codon:yes stop_codon:yes gene_type:complete
MSSNFDASVALTTSSGRVLVHLNEGGEAFPWASLNGRVIVGGPDGAHTSDGVSLSSLEWHTNRFWVVEALDIEGDEVTLDPTQYAEALAKANEDHPRPASYDDADYWDDDSWGEG